MKKIFIATCIAIATYAVNASYLYWQVTDDVITTYNDTNPGVGYTYTPGGYFKLVQTGASDAPTTTDAEGATVTMGQVNTVYQSAVTEGYSYYIEMYNSSDNLIAKSAIISNSSTPDDWTAYVHNVEISANLAVTPALISAWHGGTYTPTPEPTSAILMLFGTAFLGLKRKNRSLA